MTHAPQYALLVLQGGYYPDRMQAIVKTLKRYVPELRLPAGKLCPIIVNLCGDTLPDPLMLQAWHDLLASYQQLLSGLVVLIDPAQTDRTLMELSLEIVGQFLTPRLVIAPSWEAAQAEVVGVHQHGARR